MNKILIFGVGLIGGSIALKAKDLRLCKEIVGISRSNGTDLSPFVKSGMLDRASSNYQSEIQSADLIVLATPVAQIEITLEKIYPLLTANTLITDVGSTKTNINQAAKVFLKEKYNRNQVISVFLVIVALIYLLIKLGEVPWIGITVAVTFSLYGLIRKKVRVSSDIGLLVETLLISPIAICLFIYLVKLNINIFSVNEPVLSFYLFWAGLMTLIPLFWYTKGFNLIGIGPASMIFFLTPTAQFFLGLFYFSEPLILDKLISFIFIWIAVIIYLNELRKE